ncbi:hypothetical protein HCU64_10835 [Methylobacterium sp. C25]|uniref:hypothetical protein n=1 Tax=Methylobacterium sp. C25 TaxID=2721622 RepID=UPI001F3326A2|nr:hypothetical protein [Methylobacterium sp. C25]MCE4224247.1 hypothetical protein [Methylobacterium sp. C25]
MQGWLFGKLKWLLLIAAIGGPVLAFFCWQDGERRKDVMARGVETTASIDGATRTKGRRSGTSYKIDLSWTDAQGTRHKAKDVSVSTEYADRIIVDNKIAVDSTKIRYIADGAETPNLIISDDESHQEETDRIMIYVGAGAGIIGLLGSGLIFSRSRRRQPQPA